VQNPNIYRIDLKNGTTTNSKGEAVNSEKDGYSLTKKRQEYVLDRMLADGKITQKQHDEAYKAPIKPKITRVATGCAASSAPYFCQYVTATVLNDPAFGKTAEDRQQLLKKGGLKIYTTLDPKVQKAAQDAQNKYVPTHVDGKDRDGTVWEFGSTSVSVEAATGRVLAIAQNTEFTPTTSKEKGATGVVYAGDHTFGGSGGFNAGSTFKLFTLLDWLDQGKSLNQVVDGRLRTITKWKDSCVDGGTAYIPTNTREIGNFDHAAGIFGTPKYFTKVSLNSGYFGMAAQLDLCDIGKMATRLGVTLAKTGAPIGLATDNPLPYEIVGSDAVSPLAMAGAYATVANKGIFCQPKVIDKITDSEGQAMKLPDRTCKQVLDPKVAATAAYALQGVMQGGSGSAGNPYDGTQLMGKTGTHQDYQTWLITSNTKVTTANWVGSANGHVAMFNRWYKGTQLSQLRFVLGRTIQGAIDRIYPGGSFPGPDSNLTRQVLVDLPNVVGLSVDEATDKLEAAGFEVTVGHEVDSDQPKGTVAAQDPGAGRVAGGTNVTISPSNGKGIAVPDVTGEKPDAAVAAIRGAGFGNVDTQCTQRDDGDGTVTGTDPPAGTVAGPNTKVTVTYAAPDCGKSGKPGKPGGKAGD
jgi:membrane peptidoglycan carboxypeptidase